MLAGALAQASPPQPLTSIDFALRRSDGERMEHVRITTPAENGSESQIFTTGDLAGFDAREDATAYAES
ncbi:hypothetical protein AWB74_08034 [Caballeronia arvi]|uniref:Uncharacterized protein n=1 Tax=Caballeronia arvi TaxID=1777135 RepID=A0A158L322_9BURK|nr:hypothetical protein AWB74_08034 [Caballeronia arvi]